MKSVARLNLLALSILLAMFFASCAQTFQPTRPIDLVVHSAPGGGSDVFAREIVAMAASDPKRKSTQFGAPLTTETPRAVIRPAFDYVCAVGAGM